MSNVRLHRIRKTLVRRFHPLLYFGTASVLMSALPLSHAEEPKAPEAPKYFYGLLLRQEKKTYFVPSNVPGCEKGCLQSAPEGQLFAVVHIHSNLYEVRVVTPVGAAEPGDIIKVQRGSSGGDPRFVEVAAKEEARSPATCDWVDGDSPKMKGGVSCQGWNYKSYYWSTSSAR
jgi:hypothetical protein